TPSTRSRSVTGPASRRKRAMRRSRTPASRRPSRRGIARGCSPAPRRVRVADEVEEEGGREFRPFEEIVEPEDVRSTWRDLPRLLVASLRLVWAAGRRECFVTSSLQLLAAAGVAAQLYYF